MLKANPSKIHSKRGIRPEVAKRLKSVASEILGVKKGDKVDGIRQKKPDKEANFYTVEDDYHIPPEPWCTDFE